MVHDDDVGNILTSLGIEKHRIIPTNASQKVLRQQPRFNQFESNIPYFPLEWFDSGYDPNESQFFVDCREGLTFLPINEQNDFEWRRVSIKHYNVMANKWRIEDQNSGISAASYEVPRIYIMFNIENSSKFGKRMQHAVEQRDECENYLRFEAILDNFPMVNIPLPPVYYEKRIKDMLFYSCTHEQWIEIYQEHCIVYQKAVAAFQMIKFFADVRKLSSSNSKSSGSGTIVQIQLPRQEKRKLKNLTMHPKQWSGEFRKSKKSIQQLWIYCCPQSIKIMEFISSECKNVSRMSLFHLQGTPCSWSDFVSENNAKLLFMSNFLQTTWIDRMVGEIQICLSTVKGWFDLNVNSWYIFKMSKLYAFIELIKIRMEDAVAMLLKSSLLAFVNHLCQPCECLLDTTDDYEWNDDLTFSPFVASTLVFHMHLNIEEEPTFSIQLNRIENDIVEIFVRSILTTHHIPQIDPYLITQLKFDKCLKLSSIGLLDEDIQHQIMHLRRCYRKCLIPLNAYARKFQKYIELKHLNLDDYTRVHEIKFKNKPVEISDEIRIQMKLRDDINMSLPDSIMIGPFLISLMILKESLLIKRTQMIESLKQMLLTGAHEKVTSILQRYDAIIECVTEKPLTIEHLDKIAKYITLVPQYVQQLNTEMRATSTDFSILESFIITLPDKIFLAKWKALQMPQTVSRQVNETLTQHAIERERFRKLQESDETIFLQRLETVTDEIEMYLKEHDFDNVTEYAEEMNKFLCYLKELKERGELLNVRWQLFEQSEIDLEILDKHIERLYPYKKLWTMVSNFRQMSKKMWTQMPLSELDISIIESEMRRYDKILLECRNYFSNSEVIERICAEMEEFKASIDIVKELKNPHLHAKHWNILSEKVGGAIEYSPVTTTFADLMMRGILEIVDFVKELSCRATEEATREQGEKNS